MILAIYAFLTLIPFILHCISVNLFIYKLDLKTNIKIKIHLYFYHLLLCFPLLITCFLHVKFQKIFCYWNFCYSIKSLILIQVYVFFFFFFFLTEEGRIQVYVKSCLLNHSYEYMASHTCILIIFFNMI